MVLRILGCIAVLCGSAPAVERQTHVFKQTPQGELNLHVFLPSDWAAGQKRPVILMAFGGGFVSGSPAQFESKAEYLASRGMVAITPEYRIRNKHQTTPDKSIEDCRSAIRWVRVNASKLGVDPKRVIGSGGSAGATCMAMAALSDEFEPEGEDRSVSSKPDALVLYNPAFAVPGGELPNNIKVLTAWKARKGGPPMIQFFGDQDKLLAAAREVAKQYGAAGNRTELYLAPGVGHGFFNDRPQARGWHEAVLYQTDRFLTSLGYLKGEPAVKAPESSPLKLEK